MPSELYDAAAVEGVPVAETAWAVARHFSADTTPVPRGVDEAAAELGE